jgi:hypothetical protein
MNMRKGFIRLYIAITVPWVGWFGYMAYDANRWASYAQAKLEFLVEAIDDGDGHSFKTRALRAAQGVETDNELVDIYADQRDKQSERRKLALYALLAWPLGAPLLYIVVLWIVAGFRQRTINNGPRL